VEYLTLVANACQIGQTSGRLSQASARCSSDNVQAVAHCWPVQDLFSLVKSVKASQELIQVVFELIICAAAESICMCDQAVANTCAGGEFTSLFFLGRIQHVLLPEPLE